jgi:2-C-methyl-D-erythritol 4-phosphate cytidylyltransferase
MPDPSASVAPDALYALVPCAGTGTRAGVGGPKQYVALAGRPMVAHTLAALARVQRLAATLVVLAADDTQFERAVPGFKDGARGWVARCGGATRAASVAGGLDALLERGARETDWVLVHDAARCLVRPDWVDRLIDACLADARAGSPSFGADGSDAAEDAGGLLALPIADTLKVEREGRVEATAERRGRWAAQTPQMFRIGLLKRALAAAAARGVAVTDESSAVEALGLHPRLVEGAAENFKVTYAADFELADRLLRSAGAPAANGTVHRSPAP